MECERISDIVRNLRGAGAVNLADRIEKAAEREFRDHILAAHEREMKQMHDCCDALEDEFDAKAKEASR